MKLLQITGAQGGDTILMIVPDHHAASDVMEALQELDGAAQLQGPPVLEVAVSLPEELETEYFSVFVRVN